MPLGITQITPAVLQAQITAFINADDGFNAGRSAQKAAADDFHATEAALTEWLLVVRNILAGRFGNRWSTLWAQAGFINNSAAVPSRIEDRLALTQMLMAFFAANPTYQVASMDVTAAQASALWDAATGSQQAYLATGVALTNLGTTYTGAYEVLRGTMRALINILTATLQRDDSRWLVFGLNMPASNTTPGQPVGVTVSLNTDGTLLVACDAVPLAARYRWRMRLLGVQTDYVLAARSVAPLAVIADVLPGQTVEIIVQAVNGPLQGVASAPVVFTLPPAVAAEPKRAAAELPATNGPANGNGHARHARAA